MTFQALIQDIQHAHQQARQAAGLSVNRYLTQRNWLIGYHLLTYEQNGEDRAAYGQQLMQRLAESLTKTGLKGMSARSLRQYRQFYLAYPQIWQTLSAKFGRNLSAPPNASPAEPFVPPEKLLNHLSYSHFVELLKQEDPLKRTFYEVQAIKNAWNVRQLKRQMGSLLFERTGLSQDKASLLAKLKGEQSLLPQDIIRQPYILEFLDLPQDRQWSESELETALIDHLQQSLLELGRGFCFEARQKRITINNQHFYIDLLYYHRILKCHILIELKARAFSYTDAGQMNLYLNYFKDNLTQPDDQPPIGLVLCTHDDEAEVTYATGGLENELFVSRYLVQLPSEAELKQLLEADLQRLNT